MFLVVYELINIFVEELLVIAFCWGYITPLLLPPTPHPRSLSVRTSKLAI